jgi:pimeloyl-ACP methyl ester carboxylesterase
LLFVHGGPGQGAYPFMALQGDLLSDGLRVIGLDQRGVDRSAPLPAGAGLTIAELVEDCEAVRHELGVDRGVVLGQSFGGILALRYAVTYPDAPEQREAFRRASPRHATAEFGQAGHFVHADEPDQYARTVIAFVKGEA